MIIIGDEAGDDDVDGRQQMVVNDSDEAGGGRFFSQHSTRCRRTSGYTGFVFFPWETDYPAW